MIYKSPDQIEKEQAELTAAGVTYHKFNDFVTVTGTGVGPMPKGKVYNRVHKLTAKCLIDKKYATAG